MVSSVGIFPIEVSGGISLSTRLRRDRFELSKRLLPEKENDFIWICKIGNFAKWATCFKLICDFELGPSLFQRFQQCGQRAGRSESSNRACSRGGVDPMQWFSSRFLRTSTNLCDRDWFFDNLGSAESTLIGNVGSPSADRIYVLKFGQLGRGGVSFQVVFIPIRLKLPLWRGSIHAGLLKLLWMMRPLLANRVSSSVYLRPAGARIEVVVVSSWKNESWYEKSVHAFFLCWR